MRYRELTRKLRRLGCELDRRARGDHEIWIRPSTLGRTTIPNWGSRDLKPGTVSAILRDLKPGTVSAILRDLGVSRDEFGRA